ncbi:helix-turn-helix transcriptional regulator [Latilactobacillus curvatus]|uniref:helix-turn-helix domain-containing protein n=1 Tax=Latilactobacillus curvatus TaxID=28038 RepID=UPI0024DF7409|nr:helix-turn-helix transcriptional regulator [Latilactobacillus curvatus]WIE01501.1 helix-turn-helix transcriptional regulator [Latilactobacillus curvatus]
MIKHLKELRSEANWTQQEVADRLGISRANYSHVENNRNEPDNELLVKIADLYEVSTDYLLGKTNTRDKAGAIKEAEINDDQVIMTFDGKPIPPEDLDLIKRLLRGKE